MKFSEFQSILQGAKPGVAVYPHGANERNKTGVSLTFSPGGKVYTYNGSYTDILHHFGVGPHWQVRDYSGVEGWSPVVTCWTHEEAETERSAYLTRKNSNEYRATSTAWGATWSETPADTVKVVNTRTGAIT